VIPSTRQRVPQHTASRLNEHIQDQIEHRVAYYSQHVGEIERRLRELDREWDIERAIELNASALALLGTSLGRARNRNWLILPMLVTGNGIFIPARRAGLVSACSDIAKARFSYNLRNRAGAA
jgi:hypothetical protein